MKTLNDVQIIITGDNKVSYNYNGTLYTKEEFEDTYFPKESKKVFNSNTERYNALFTEDDMLDDAVQKYLKNQITKDDLKFYLKWNEFEDNDIDWNKIENAKKEVNNDSFCR